MGKLNYKIEGNELVVSTKGGFVVARIQTLYLVDENVKLLANCLELAHQQGYFEGWEAGTNYVIENNF